MRACVRACVRVCVCVCERERERERETVVENVTCTGTCISPSFFSMLFIPQARFGELLEGILRRLLFIGVFARYRRFSSGFEVFSKG